ncbi:uncharacterized protein LOC8275000 [Ricinus communis]|uniref:Uncharacterized protein n=1 Tax=Ricinus communis TaxID=3988 RepID=B9RFU9_RICCO|nr:uncharacterized protein LOC8275000 [Ricinus communis]EEF50070.1 conserved hypothetical protein [Ricinus communis]|eukprot:XP_002512618.1 uncharacterized protein LOC8275000 [Ricinus communis]
MSSCPIGFITYNTTLCACPAGWFLNRTTNSCTLFAASSDIQTDTGLANTLSFPETIFSFDSIKKFTQSQAVFLEATSVMLISWLLFCFFLRFMKFGDGSNIWFKIRWWLSRLDICFATRHWLDDQQVVVKRKTELGGTFSIASWILFIGLFAALLYQIILKRSIEVHNVKAINAPDLASFANDIEFNITTVSSMSCSNLRDLGTLVTGSPGFIDHRVVNLIELANYTCWNTSTGPTLNFKCTNCRLNKDYMYISWTFVDLPNAPASAVGYLFNLTTRNHADKRHFSFVSGTLKNGSSFDDRPVTFRGRDPNILKFNLFPRIYRNLHDLKLIQPLFHEFIPGSFFHDTTQLKASLATSSGGLINTTIYVQYLSAYVVEVENQNIMGPVSFLADLGGLYCISICIFFYFLVQCEYRIKKLRNEDSTMRNIRNRLKAQKHWEKLRKYVRYRWGCSTLDDDLKNSKQGSSCNCIMAPSVRGNGSISGSGSSWRRGSRTRTDSIRLNKRVSIPSDKNAIEGHSDTQVVEHVLAGCTLNTEGINSDSAQGHSVKGEVLGCTKDETKHSVGLHDASESQAHLLTDDSFIPFPPPLEFKPESEIENSDIQKNLQHMYNYNIILREKLLATRSLLHSLATKSSTSLSESQT